MAVEVQVAADLNEPGATARATGHIAGDGDHITAPMLPESAERTLAGLSGLAIERIPSGIAIVIERWIDRQTKSPTDATAQVGQHRPASKPHPRLAHYSPPSLFEPAFDIRPRP